MRYGTRLLLAMMAVMALTGAPAVAAEGVGGSACAGLETALSHVSNERARAAIAAKAGDLDCVGDEPTVEEACASISGIYLKDPLQFGNSLPGVVDWHCQFQVEGDMTRAAAEELLLPYCASGTGSATGETTGGTSFFQCFYE